MRCWLYRLLHIAKPANTRDTLIAMEAVRHAQERHEEAALDLARLTRVVTDELRERRESVDG